jgi:hypothetical protein
MSSGKSKKSPNKLSRKSLRFNKALIDAKDALDSIDIHFHLHSGTALGAHRDKDFIKHDGDIDLGVFYKDVDTPYKVNQIIKSMENHGFELSHRMGKLTRGLELQFVHDKTDVSLDIFWVYEGKYKGIKYFILQSYLGKCDDYKYKACVWAYRPYETVRLNFLGKVYNSMPKQTLEDAYGADWRIPKKFGYYQGLTEGYQSLVPDFYEPKSNPDKIAFCFLLYNKHNHGKNWLNFFKEDNYSEKSYSIYSHLKEVTDQTQPWLLDNRVPTIKTGWCEDSLVWAWIKMLKEALKDPSNKYFVLLSGECLPLYGFWDTYKKIMSSKKSRINVTRNSEATFETGLLYADQWVLLNRTHAQLLVDLKETNEGKEFTRYTKSIMKDFCADELYPVNWFAHKVGKPSSKEFRREFNLVPTTYTRWEGKQPHPIKFNSPKMKKYHTKICESGALFARKFNNKAGIEVTKSCSRKRK